MDKPNKTNFTEEAVERLYIDIKKFSIYGKKEQKAICGYIPMTQEIFDKCYRFAAALYDDETIEYLLLTFPEFI